MEKYCTSLEVSKRLKEAGWKKETKFSWFSLLNTEGWGLASTKELDEIVEPFRYHAPIAGEILEELPVFVGLYKTEMHGYCVRYIDNFFRSTNLADALAECWIWAKENNLLEVKR